MDDIDTTNLSPGAAERYRAFIKSAEKFTASTTDFSDAAKPKKKQVPWYDALLFTFIVALVLFAFAGFAAILWICAVKIGWPFVAGVAVFFLVAWIVYRVTP